MIRLRIVIDSRENLNNMIENNIIIETRPVSAV